MGKPLLFTFICSSFYFVFGYEKMFDYVKIVLELKDEYYEGKKESIVKKVIFFIVMIIIGNRTFPCIF